VAQPLTDRWGVPVVVGHDVRAGLVAESGEQLLAPLRAHLDAARTFQRPVRVVRAELGDRAGCLGAACLAWQVSLGWHVSRD
jgi:predicted NBD/HSP70 family sugar kinase